MSVIEELVDLTTQKMSILKKMNVENRDEGFMNSIEKIKEECRNLKPSGRTTH